MSCCGACGGQDLENEQTENKKAEQSSPREITEDTEQTQNPVESFDPRQ